MWHLGVVRLSLKINPFETAPRQRNQREGVGTVRAEERVWTEKRTARGVRICSVTSAEAHTLAGETVSVTDVIHS